MNKPNETLETSTLVPHVNIKTFAFASTPNYTDLFMNTHFATNSYDRRDH